MIVRAESEHEHAAIAALVEAAFGSTAEVDLIAAIRGSDGYLPDLSLVAVIDGVVVGHVMLSRVTVDDAGTRHEVLSLAPLAVAPDHQGIGVGSHLVREATRRAATTDFPAVVLEGSPGYYGRLGFAPAADSGITMDLPEWAPLEAAQVFRLPRWDPAIRGRVAYPPAFDVVLDG